MLRKISNYEYRENTTKNTSDSSSGCEDDFDADDSYVHDGDAQDYISQINEMTSATETSLNLSPMPHFPPPPDYPPPTSTRNKCRYYYHENGKTYLSHSNQHHIGNIDRDCDYTTDGNDVCSQYRKNTLNQTNNRIVNNSCSSTSRSSNNSVLVHNTMKNPQTQLQHPTKKLDAIELCTEQEKPYPFRLHSATTKMNKVNYCTNTADFLEKNSIRIGGGAATIAHNFTNIEPQVSLSIQK